MTSIEIAKFAAEMTNRILNFFADDGGIEGFKTYNNNDGYDTVSDPRPQE